MSSPDKMPEEKVNILLVDDQPGRLLSYEAILRDLGQNIVRASSGVEALQQLMRDEFAVILLDVNMPGMDGFETAQMIHQHPRYEHTPLVFVTAFHVSEMDRLKGYELGAVDYVYIPVIPEILRSKVMVLVELYVKKRELVRLNASLERANSLLQLEKTRELEALNLTLAEANAQLERTNQHLKAQIAERQRAEDARRLSEERLHTILQNTSALIYQVDVEGRFVHVNKQYEELLGLDVREVRGRTLSEVSPDVSREFDLNNRLVLDQCRVMTFEERMELLDGVRVYSAIKAPLFDMVGAPYGVVGVSTDITERKRLETALKEADRRKDEFIALMAHELRNPLAAIVNGLELVRHKTVVDEEFVWSRTVIDRQVQHLCRLIEDLLDVSRITHGKIKLQREVVDFATIVARAVETAKPLVDASRHELTIELPTDTVYVDGDPTRLVQVIGNLLNNAVKYTPDGGHIHLRVTHDDMQIVARVSDDGVGVLPEMRPKLFELFSQYDHAVARAQGGLGIGLALVRRIVELHGGDVWVHSEGAGTGSEFFVSLPRHGSAPAPVARPAARAPEPVLGPARILVVDDNVDSADSLGLVLRHFGHSVRTVHSGEEAVEQAAAFAPDVILLDLGMPGMDGYEAARRIRASPRGAEPYVIALTGWSQSDAREATARAGFDLHLVKPVDVTVLRRVLDAQAATKPRGDRFEGAAREGA